MSDKYFRPLETFWAEETKTRYVTDLNYTLVPENDLLAGLVETWIAEGKVEFTDAPLIKISGHGKVI